MKDTVRLAYRDDRESLFVQRFANSRERFIRIWKVNLTQTESEGELDRETEGSELEELHIKDRPAGWENDEHNYDFDSGNDNTINPPNDITTFLIDKKDPKLLKQIFSLEGAK
ncbi:hypothetical protein Sjap_001173 [Stephania japonica]|uniref:Uncharacterized protein n=1 Tax=Stephania japonica TaxID=461633 RepID=A0AAP0KKZ7_9MAGN